MSTIPTDLKFTKTHEWVKVAGDEATVGITEHAQQLLGDMVFVELPEMGSQFNLGDELGVVESVKAASDVYAPVSGAVIAINNQVTEDPALVNKEPYGDGWIVKLKLTNPDEVTQLLTAAQYQDVLVEEH